VPYSLELFALRRVTPRAFGVLLSLDPAVAALVGLLVLGQHLAWRELVALVLVVAANAGSVLAGEAEAVAASGVVPD
jgi:inner membrane transporter RhtA